MFSNITFILQYNILVRVLQGGFTPEVTLRALSDCRTGRFPRDRGIRRRDSRLSSLCMRGGIPKCEGHPAELGRGATFNFNCM